MNEMQLNELLRKAGFKATKPRIMILKALVSDSEPKNAEAIFEKVKTKDINQVTVYRTLTAFAEKGIINRVDLRKGSVYYELPEEHHHHIVCTDCGLIEHFENAALETVLHKVSSKNFSLITDHACEFFGRCKKCAC